METATTPIKSPEIPLSMFAAEVFTASEQIFRLIEDYPSESQIALSKNASLFRGERESYVLISDEEKYVMFRHIPKVENQPVGNVVYSPYWLSIRNSTNKGVVRNTYMIYMRGITKYIRSDSSPKEYRIAAMEDSDRSPIKNALTEVGKVLPAKKTAT